GRSSRQNVFTASRSKRKCLPPRRSTVLGWGPDQNEMLNGKRWIIMISALQEGTSPAILGWDWREIRPSPLPASAVSGHQDSGRASWRYIQRHRREHGARHR